MQGKIDDLKKKNDVCFLVYNYIIIIIIIIMIIIIIITIIIVIIIIIIIITTIIIIIIIIIIIRYFVSRHGRLKKTWKLPIEMLQKQKIILK